MQIFVQLCGLKLMRIEFYTPPSHFSEEILITLLFYSTLIAISFVLLSTTGIGTPMCGKGVYAILGMRAMIVIKYAL